MAPKPLSNLNPSKKKEEIQRSLSSEEESEEHDSGDEVAVAQENSDSDFESDESPSAYKIQPVPEPPAAKTKRAHVEDTDGQASPKSAKKMKPEEKKAGMVAGSYKLWSDADEVVLLKRLLENVKSNKEDIGAVYDTIKGKLQVQVTKEQLRGKINGLKKKYHNAMKRQPDGSDPVYSKPHEVMVFELSKKLWEANGVDGKEKGIKNDDGEEVHVKLKKDAVNGEKNGKGGKKIVACEEEDEQEEEESMIQSKYRFLQSSFDDLAQRHPSMAMSDAMKSLVEEKLRLAGSKVAKDLNEKWKQLITEETELHYKMITLMKEQIELALNQ